MTRKTYNLIVGLVGGLETISVAIVTFINPEFAAAINASILIGGTAINEICAQFVKKD